MKLFFITLFLSISTDIHSQSVFDFKKDMVWIENAKLFVCKYEVTNVEYHAFTSELLKDTISISKKKFYSSYYPDTTLWISEFVHHIGDPMNAYYFWHNAFAGFPVSGVRYDGAVKYCEWLTKKYGEGKYKFRLPTKKEFSKYASVGNAKFAGGLETPRDENGKYFFNCRPNRINLDDSLSKVFYNPLVNTFIRCYDDTATKEKNESYGTDLEGYDYYVENSYDGYLYLTGWRKKLLKLKIPDSITLHNPNQKTYTREKLELQTNSNYYDDGYMYTSATRANKSGKGPEFYWQDGNLKPMEKIEFKSHASSYPADKNGLFDLNGNVSELVSEEGCLMGSNWGMKIKDCNYNVERKIDDIHQIMIGFRIVAEKLQ